MSDPKKTKKTEQKRLMVDVTKDVTMSLDGCRLVGVIDTLQELQRQLTEKGWTDIVFDTSVWNDYGDERVKVELSGRRLETDGEFHKRISTEKYQQEWKEKRDRQEYERLKKKFKDT